MEVSSQPGAPEACKHGIKAIFLLKLVSAYNIYWTYPLWSDLTSP